MKNSQLERLVSALVQTNTKLSESEAKCPIKFSYALARNMTIAGKSFDSMMADRKDLLKSFCKTTKEGEIATEKFVLNQDAIDAQVEGEGEPINPIIQERISFDSKKKEEAANEAMAIFMDEEVEIELYKFPDLQEWAEGNDSVSDHSVLNLMFSITDIVNNID